MTPRQSRRAFLRTVGQAATTLPFYRMLESSAAEAAEGDQPQRFLGLYLPHGIAGPLYERRAGETETNYSLTFAGSVLSPFDDATTYGKSFKDKLITIEGIDLAAGIEKSVNGHDAASVILTGSAPVANKSSHPSLDQYLAVDRGLGADTRFASLALAVGNDQTDSGWNLSYGKAGTPLPKVIDPVQVFEMVFAGLFVQGDAAAKLRAERERRTGTSVLDYLRKDIGRLSSRLAGPEAVKLEQHLNALRAIEKQLEDVQGVCAVPAKPGSVAFPKLRAYNGGEPYFNAITDLHIDLVAQAIVCDLTRFVTLFMNDLSRTKMYSDLPEDVHNGVAHTYDPPGILYGNPGNPGRPETWARLAVQNKYSFGKMARLMQKLDQGGVLDSSLIYASSDMGDPARHSLRNPPTLLAGGVGGKLQMGRRIVLGADCPPGKPYCEKPNLIANNKILVSICQLFGVPTESFGTAADQGITRGALPELLG